MPIFFIWSPYPDLFIAFSSKDKRPLLFFRPRRLLKWVRWQMKHCHEVMKILLPLFELHQERPFVCMWWQQYGVSLLIYLYFVARKRFDCDDFLCAIVTIVCTQWHTWIFASFYIELWIANDLLHDCEDLWCFYIVSFCHHLVGVLIGTTRGNIVKVEDPKVCGQTCCKIQLVIPVRSKLSLETYDSLQIFSTSWIRVMSKVTAPLLKVEIRRRRRSTINIDNTINTKNTSL